MIYINFSLTNNKIRPACLYAYNDYENSTVVMSGWGFTNKSDILSEELHKIPIKIMNLDKCQSSYQNISALDKGISNAEGCYQPLSEKDVCAGFSGAGATVNIDGYEYLVGVSSFIHTCGSDIPRVFSKISAYIDWIETVLWPQYI